MSDTRLSAENLHASSIARDGRAVLLVGQSGSGKSDLALRLLNHGFTLVSDDRTIVSKERGKLFASAPLTIKGKLEIRGIGIVDVESIDNVPVALVVELTSTMERMPDDSRERRILGVQVPLVSVDAMTASAASKVALALSQFGTKF